jgi:hypothetical protein
MKIYDCKIHVGGDLHTEVRKENVTPAELALLAFLHGGHEHVVDIKEVGTARRTDRAERKRLETFYSFGEVSGQQLVRQLFGLDTMPLPQEYVPPAIDEPDEDVMLAGDEDDVDDLDEIVRKPVTANILD